MNNGLVIRTTGSWYRVMNPDGEVIDCRLRGNYRLRGSKQTNPIAVGDRVAYALQPDGNGVIQEVCDRRNCIIRRATNLSKQTHVVAANIDLFCIVATLCLPRTSTGFIDRLLATSEAYGIAPCLVFNKVDLYDDALWEAQRELSAIYEAVGYHVLHLSAADGTGLDALRSLAAGRTILMGGHSGVGKSALINALAPGLNLRVGDISQWSLKGRHTTTFAEIIPAQLSDGSITYFVDTPGVKEFGLVGFEGPELSHFFPEMKARLTECHFANCTHRHEPGCAIKEAVAQGLISEERYRNYLAIYDSIENP